MKINRIKYEVHKEDERLTGTCDTSTLFPRVRLNDLSDPPLNEQLFNFCSFFSTTMPSSNLGPALGKPIAEGLTLPIQLGNIAEQGPLDLQEARSRSQAFFRPENIENVLRNGAEENKIRKEVLDVIVKDEVFGDWKRKR